MTDATTATDQLCGLPPRHIDSITERLSAYAKAFEDAQGVRKASHLRGDEFAAGLFKLNEDVLSRRLGKELRKHVLWSFLSERKGLAGPLSARVIALIGDPRRFPGQKCSIGHTLPPVFEVGSACPITATDKGRESDDHPGGGEVSSNTEVQGENDRIIGVAGVSNQAEASPESEQDAGLVGSSDTEVDRESDRRGGVGDSHTADERQNEIGVDGVRCMGVMLPPRPHTGVRSLWHYAGLHVIDGKLPRRRKGVQADWNPTLRTLALQPNGIADQIIKHRTEPYRTIYDKARERGKFHSVARAIAAKAFLGDLLIEWKRLVGEVDTPCEDGSGTGFSEEVA